ncbi:LpxA family transferase [Chromobacterium sp.]|uniref:LpxA family transferase n=1 Tax=Chromobacterium sp. TaxID=306190 RepID=UPI0035B446B6
MPSNLAAELFPDLLTHFPWLEGGQPPWLWLNRLPDSLSRVHAALDPAEWTLDGDIAIHHSAMIEAGAILKGPLLIGPGCRIAAHAYLRGGVALANDVTVGPGCELKTCVIGPYSRLAHFNFVGDAVLGADVNMEAGAVIANHWNERRDKTITVRCRQQAWTLPTQKFGALVGDHSRIGANAVLSPGTLLPPHAVVARLALVEQDPILD